jgi:ADP-ribosyl-[dinitrogen reductase] hydrolase
MLAETPGKLAGNGSVMRCAPIALRYRHDRERLRQVSIDVARMTHPDPMATWGSVALNQAIAYLLEGGDLDTVSDAAVEGVEHPEVVETILTAADRDYADVRSGGFVLETLGASFWAIAHRDSAEEAIVAAVSMGDDTDTTGAVTGALVGAHYGVTAIPRRWVDVLEPRDELVELAGKLLAWGEAEAAR